MGSSALYRLKLVNPTEYWSLGRLYEEYDEDARPKAGSETGSPRAPGNLDRQGRDRIAKAVAKTGKERHGGNNVEFKTAKLTTYRLLGGGLGLGRHLGLLAHLHRFDVGRHF